MTAGLSNQPLNAAQPLDVAGPVPRSRLSFRSHEEGTRHMALNLRDSAGAYPPDIQAALEEHGYGGKDGAVAGEYRLPLGRVRSIPADDADTEADVGLMPVIPVRFADPEGERLAPVRDGWLYVFINGHLWREIQVGNEGEVFHDVNLARHQGRDARPATCEALFHHVSLPYRINGTAPVLEVAYADVQWSWATIERMGGRDPEDRRYCPDLPVYESYNVTVDDSLRESRCQRIDLAAYDGAPDINRLRETFLLPTETAETHCNASGDLDQPPQLPGLTEDDITAGFAIMAVHDPLGVAMEFIGTIQDETQTLKACIEEIDQHEHVESAVIAYQMFFNEGLHEDRSTRRGTRYTDRSNEASELRSVAGDMDRDYLETLLQVEERRAIRERIREARNALGHWLDGKCPNGDPADGHVAQPVTVVQAIKDYAALPPAEYWRLWATVNGLTAGAGPDPAQIDSGYDADPDDPEDDPLSAWQARLTDPEHPLYPMLFPNADQVPLDDDTPPATDDLNELTGQTDFRPGAFALMLNGAASGGAFRSIGRDVAWLGREVVRDFMYVVQRQWQAALDQQQNLSVDVFMRIGKAGQFPELEGARLVREGDVIPEGYTVIGSQVERLHRMQRGARRQAARDAVRNPGADAVVMLDGSTNNPIASSGLQGLAPATTSVAAATDSDWRALFSAEGADGLYRTRADLIVVPTVSETVRELSQPDAEPFLTTSRTVRAAQVGLPPIIAVFEVVNIYSAAQAFRSNNEGRRAREFSAFALSLAGLAFALTEASLNIAGQRETRKVLSRVIGPRLARWVAEGQMRVLGGGRVSSMAVLGAGLAGFGAALAATDMRYRLQQGETAAGLAHGVEAAALTGLMVSNLIARVPQAGWAALFKLGPWGWAFLATGIVAGAVARHLIRGPLERWAYYGPFSADHDRRLTEEYAGLEPRQVRLALKSLLFAPQVMIKEDERFSPPRVRVEVRAPAVARAIDSVELYATSEGGGGQQPLEAVATGELPDGSGPLCQAWWFRLPDPNDWYVTRDGRRHCILRARARLRREGDGTLPFNPNHAGSQASDTTIDPEGETEDWAYADALTIRKTQRQINQEF